MKSALEWLAGFSLAILIGVAALMALGLLPPHRQNGYRAQEDWITAEDRARAKEVPAEDPDHPDGCPEGMRCRIIKEGAVRYCRRTL